MINAAREKHLTNVRASGNDENIVLAPPVILTLETAIDFIEDDELIEVTPKSIRIRKTHLKEIDRKRSGR
jgi:GTP-binding protein